MEPHENECVFRKVPCPTLVQQGTVTVSVTQASLHEEDAGFLLNRNLTGTTWTLRLIQLAGLHFVLQLEVDASGCYNAWVHALASEEKAGQFRASISLLHNGQSHGATNGRVHPVDTSNNEAMADKDCFMLHKKQVQQCMETRVSDRDRQVLPGCCGKLLITYTIKKIKNDSELDC